MNSKIKIEVKSHLLIPNDKVIEISDDNQLIATIIPRDSEIVVLSDKIKKILMDTSTIPDKCRFILDSRLVKIYPNEKEIWRK